MPFKNGFFEVLRNCNVPQSQFNKLFAELTAMNMRPTYQSGKAKLSALHTNKKTMLSEYLAKYNYYAFYRTVVTNCIKNQSTPFIHASLYPTGYKNIFTFRVDSDGYTKESFTAVKNTSEEHDIPLTWFIDVSTHDMKAVESLKEHGHDIEPHCFYHFLHQKKAKSQKDYQKAIKALRDIGIQTNGIAAPYGHWNENIDVLYEELGIDFASDFSCSYESIPHFPISNNRISKTLQIPIHPVCFGTLMEAGFNHKEIRNYFHTYISHCYETELPINLYGHPLGRMDKHIDIFSDLLSKINSYTDIWCPTYTELNNWWRKRVQTNYDITYVSHNKVQVQSTNSDPSLALSIWISSDEFTQIPMISGIYNLDTLTYRKIRQAIPLIKETVSLKEYMTLLAKNIWTTMRMCKDDLLVYTDA